jgi:hypothetical protein
VYSSLSGDLRWVGIVILNVKYTYNIIVRARVKYIMLQRLSPIQGKFRLVKGPTKVIQTWLISRCILVTEPGVDNFNETRNPICISRPASFTRSLVRRFLSSRIQDVSASNDDDDHGNYGEPKYLTDHQDPTSSMSKEDHRVPKVNR